MFQAISYKLEILAQIALQVANYDYGFFWYFYQDGTIHFESKMTGLINVIAADADAKYSHGQKLPARGLYAPIHQHIFCTRLDFCLDGQENSVSEVNIVSDANERRKNQQGNAFRAVEAEFTRELEAQRKTNSDTQRCKITECHTVFVDCFCL